MQQTKIEHEVIEMKLLHIRVCSNGTEDEALEWVRHHDPAGTAGNWGKQKVPHLAPVDCASKKGFRHFVFQC